LIKIVDLIFNKFNAMKLFISCFVWYVLIFSGFTVTTGYAQANYNCYIKNITQTSPTTLEFDIWLESTGVDTFKLTFIQAGIDFNYNGIINGGTLSGLMVANSADPSLPPSQQTHPIQINTTSKQYRIAASVANATIATTMIPPPGMNLGTFRITNTVPFTANSTPDFQWSFVNTPNQTQTAIGAYVNGATTGINLTIPANHFVLGNPVLNQIPNPTLAVLTNGSGADTICTGNTANIQVAIQGGVSPYTVIYSDGSQQDTVFNYLSGTDITVTPLVTTTYSLVSITDNSNNPCLANNGLVSVIVKNNTNLSLSQNGNAASVIGIKSSAVLVGEANQILFIDDECNRIGQISDLPGGNNPGLCNVSVQVENAVPNINGQPYTERWYSVVPSNNQNLNCEMSVYFTMEDFINYNAANGSFRDFPTTNNANDPNVANIRLMQRDFNDQLTFLIPQTSWNNTLNCWEIRFPVNRFLRYALTSINPDTISAPANIISFTGRKLQNSDELTWKATEKNMSQYKLYHSGDTLNFSLIKTVFSKAPNGNSSNPLTYITQNLNPLPGHNYYKLQLIDKNGDAWFHPQLVHLFWSSAATPIIVYPDGNQGMNIDFYSLSDQSLQIRLIDMSGRTIRVMNALVLSGNNKLKLPMDRLAQGIYQLQIFNAAEKLFSEKIFK
jgi:hypothetical protein